MREYERMISGQAYPSDMELRHQPCGRLAMERYVTPCRGRCEARYQILARPSLAAVVILESPFVTMVVISGG